MSPGSGIAPLAVTADAGGSSSADGGPLASFQFDFGDGAGAGPQPGATATHTFSTAGTYQVTVTVTDAQGRTDTASGTVVVHGADAAPVARLSVSPSSGSAPLAVTADASGSTDTDGWPIASYTFDFGDGTTVGPRTGATAAHTYTGAGTFTVTVTVTDTAGLAGTATAPVSVAPAPPVNLVGNSGFETSTTGWNNNGRSGISVTRTAGGHTGSFAAVLANSTGSTLADCTLNDSPNWVAKTTSGTYVATMWVRADTAGTTLRLRFREYAGSTFSGQAIGSVVLTNGWQQVTVSYVPTVPGGFEPGPHRLHAERPERPLLLGRRRLHYRVVATVATPHGTSTRTGPGPPRLAERLSPMPPRTRLRPACLPVSTGGLEPESR